ncbi:MAG: hypothetical protein JRE40_04640 [Deltaproteobacteria bacterium]|nr:hypothetical protein [Deltaproteobacteria bacterium]
MNGEEVKSCRVCGGVCLLPPVCLIHARVKRCKDCGRVAEVSRHNLCSKCARRRILESARSLHEKHGIWYERWREALLKSLSKKRR